MNREIVKKIQRGKWCKDDKMSAPYCTLSTLFRYRCWNNFLPLKIINTKKTTDQCHVIVRLLMHDTHLNSDFGLTFHRIFQLKLHCTSCLCQTYANDDSLVSKLQQFCSRNSTGWETFLTLEVLWKLWGATQKLWWKKESLANVQYLCFFNNCVLGNWRNWFWNFKIKIKFTNSQTYSNRLRHLSET
jgi:hypothetical protein